VRFCDGRNPKRAIIDRDLELPISLNVFDNSVKTFVFNKTKTTIEDKKIYIGIEDFDYFLPQYILYQLYLQDIQSVIIEGGAKTLQTFIDANLWDEARIFTSNQNWNTGLKAPSIHGNMIENINLGDNKLNILKPIPA
jgi:diaminohydroxyphosphoribosylaminopyrimidine deaminase/5-amino-6-(5-phosphoribosylamino)uracil reductase